MHRDYSDEEVSRLTKEVSVYDTPIMNSTPTYQSDFAPELTDPQISSEQALRRSKIDSISYS